MPRDFSTAQEKALQAFGNAPNYTTTAYRGRIGINTIRALERQKLVARNSKEPGGMFFPHGIEYRLTPDGIKAFKALYGG